MSILDMSDAFEDLLEPIVVSVSSPGSRIKGHWVPGAVTMVNSYAVAQPASNEDINELKSEGDKTSSYKKFYSTHVFKAADKALQTEADIITYNGEQFKVLTVTNWASLGNYNKVMTIRI